MCQCVCVYNLYNININVMWNIMCNESNTILIQYNV